MAKRLKITESQLKMLMENKNNIEKEEKVEEPKVKTVAISEETKKINENLIKIKAEFTRYL